MFDIYFFIVIKPPLAFSSMLRAALLQGASVDMGNSRMRSLGHSQARFLLD